MKSSIVMATFPIIGLATIIVLVWVVGKYLAKFAFKFGWWVRGYYELYKSYPLVPHIEENTNPLPTLEEVVGDIIEDTTPESSTPEGGKLETLTFRQLRKVARQFGVRQKVDGRDLSKRELILAIEEARLLTAIAAA